MYLTLNVFCDNSRILLYGVSTKELSSPRCCNCCIIVNLARDHAVSIERKENTFLNWTVLKILNEGMGNRILSVFSFCSDKSGGPFGVSRLTF